MKLGLLVESEEGLDWADWRATYTIAERLGFDSVWLSDHLVSPWSGERHGLDPWVALTVAAAETQRLTVGPLVTPITFREAVILARMAESIDKLAPGRFVLGLGRGWNADEHARFGLRFPPASERLNLLRAGVAQIRALHGERHVPILLGGAPTGILRLVANSADSWNVTTADAVFFRERSDRLTEECLNVDRDPASVERSVAVGFLVGRDRAEIERRARRMQALVPPLAQVAVDDVPEEARRRGWVVGTPDEIVASLNDLHKAGADLAILGHYDLKDSAALELIAAEVSPRLA